MTQEEASQARITLTLEYYEVAALHSAGNYMMQSFQIEMGKDGLKNIDHLQLSKADLQVFRDTFRYLKSALDKLGSYNVNM